MTTRLIYHYFFTIDSEKDRKRFLAKEAMISCSPSYSCLVDWINLNLLKNYFPFLTEPQVFNDILSLTLSVTNEFLDVWLKWFLEEWLFI